MQRWRQWILSVSFGFSTQAMAFDSTAVLPSGVRNLNLKNVSTSMSQKTDDDARSESLAAPLQKPLKFKDILKNESGLKRTQLAAFLQNEGLKAEDSVGDFQADLNASVNVTALVMAYGLSDRVTLAVGVPYYQAASDVQMAFTSNAGADRFLTALRNPNTLNSTESAVEAGEKLNDAVNRLNKKLRDNGYAALSPWHREGLGDTTIAAKYRYLDQDIVKSALTTGLVAPTGMADNPDILTDIPFGDDQWDVFTQLSVDEHVTPQVFFNQYAKYTYQAPGSHVMRLKTAEEPIEVASADVRFKLGDKVESGASLQWEQDNGVVSGIGGQYVRKFGDRYQTGDQLAKHELEWEKDQEGRYAEVQLGYSTVQAYKRQEFPVPMKLSTEYKHLLWSRNMPLSHLWQIDLNMYF